MISASRPPTETVTFRNLRGNEPPAARVASAEESERFLPVRIARESGASAGGVLFGAAAL